MIRPVTLGRTPRTLALTLALGVVVGASIQGAGMPLSSQASAETPPGDAIASAETLSSAFEYAAETIAPSVVTIQSTREVELPAPLRRMPRGLFFGLPFERFFGDDPFRRFDDHDQFDQRRLQMGEGSGVIVSEAGYILTNHHVVDGASEVTVILADDRQYTAEVVGTDPKTDLAVVKIDSYELTPARFGDSDELRVGQWVVAAGNPYGLDSTITTGIISATGRSRMGITDYEDFIQTDAAINRGNSGGPLVNLRGEVVGINTAILSRTGGSIGLGFAIPINMARKVMDELIEDGRVVRGYLGVLIQDLTGGMAESFGYDGTNGALVSDVVEDGPAAEAGLRPGDIITHLDGEPVAGVDQLRLRVAETDPDTKIDLSIVRGGEPRTLTVTIAELGSEMPVMSASESADPNLGMTVETLTPALAQRFGADRDARGVVVTGLEAMGPAARAGIGLGDVITHVMDEPVATVNAFRREVRSHDLSKGVHLKVERDAQSRFVFLQLR